MAYTLNYGTLPGLTAGADLSSNQFQIGKLASTAGKVVLAGAINTTTPATVFIGVIMNAPASGEEVEFAISGVAKVIVATSTIAIGDGIGSNSTSKGTDAGTTDNTHRLGRALVASAAPNDIIPVALYGAGGVRY